MTVADQRCHGTTREAPIARFDRDERSILRPLPLRVLPRRERGRSGSRAVREVKSTRGRRHGLTRSGRR